MTTEALSWEPMTRLSPVAMKKLVDRRRAAAPWESREQSESVCTMSVTLINGVRPSGILKPHRTRASGRPAVAQSPLLPPPTSPNATLSICGLCGASSFNEIHHDDNGDPIQ